MANDQKTACKNEKKPCGKTVAFFIAVCLLAFVLPFRYFTTGSGLKLKTGIFIKVLVSMLKSDERFLFFPVVHSSVSGLAISACIYVLFLGLIAAVVLFALALKNRSNCLLKAATFVFAWATALYTLSILVVTSYATTIRFSIDPVSCILAICGAVYYFKLLFKEYDKNAWLLVGQFLFSLLAAGFMLLALTRNGSAVSNAMRSRKIKLLLTLSATAAMASLAFTTVLVLKLNKWTTILQLINAGAMLALSVCTLLLFRFIGLRNGLNTCCVLATAVVSFVQILLCVFAFYLSGKKDDSDFLSFLSNKYRKETYVEVLPYNGDAANVPVAQLVDEETTATEEIPDDPQKEALFEGKEDEFIATLSKEEKYEFVDLYVLKTKGEIAGIPVYEIGKENEEFFAKVFVYLSRYREKISSSLLAKIYDYSQKD